MFLLLLLELGGPVNRANKKRLLVFGSRINYLQVLVYPACAIDKTDNR